MNTAEYIVKKLEELGVNDFFGLPGDYNFNILSAVENNPNTKWIGCTNELNAGYAADGYARLRGYGALITTYGVGELSAINAVAGCYAENIPVVHIVGLPSTKNIEDRTLIHHNFQEVDYHTFICAYEKVTAASALLTRDNAKMEIDRVFKILVKEKKPVYIALPMDIAKMEISDRYVDYEWTGNKETLKEVALAISDRINDSEKPVIIGDVLIKRFDSIIEYKEFVSKSGIPVTNFLMGTNLIDANSENNLGGYYGVYGNPQAEKYVKESDCLIAIGTVCSDLNAFGLKIPDNAIQIFGTYTIIDGKRYDNVKMAEVLEKVTELIDPKNIRIEKTEADYEYKPALNLPLNSEYIYSRLQEFIKENDIIIAETGTVPFGIGKIKFPPHVDIQFQMLWGSIGWATPAILGASLAKPKSRALLISGEGAHQLTAMEVGNMLRQGIKPVIIVINNDGYTIERLLCENPNAEFNDIIHINYAKFARVFDGDVWATRVTTADDFDKALKVTQIMNKMCYIEVCTGKDEAPELIKNMVQSIKKTIEKEPIPVTIHNNFDKDDFKLSSVGFNYETTVHKVLKEDTKTIDKEEHGEN